MSSSPERRPLRFAAAISTHENSRQALHEVCDQALQQLGGVPDLAFFFISQAHAGSLEAIAAEAVERLQTQQVLGCTAESVIAGPREVEQEPAITLWLAQLPEVQIRTMHLTFERTADGGSVLGWPDELLTGWPDKSTLLVLGEPFTFPAEVLLERINEDRPGVPVFGGMASGGAAPGENLLICGNQVLAEGAVVAMLSGPVRVKAVVSQGCRPIGRPFVVTKAEGNVIYELGGKPALAQLKELFEQLPNEEKQLVQRGLHLGRVVSEYQDHFEQGDFLVRNVLGIDARKQAIAVGDYIRPGQTVQFQIRDERTADHELRQLLGGVKNATHHAQGALLFSCNGRGSRMFQQPDHDASVVQEALGPIPLAGFFAQGEIGPIGGRNFVHGFTASLVIFEEA